MNVGSIGFTGALRSNSHRWRAFGSALGLEAAGILALVAWISLRPPELALQPIALVIEPLVAEKIEAPPEAAPPKAPPAQVALSPAPKVVKQVVRRPQPEALPPQPQMPVPPAHPQVVVMPVASAAPSYQDPSSPLAPAPVVEPVIAKAVLSNPSVAPPAAPSVDVALAYNAKLAAAVQAAFEVPASVAALSFRGRARVEFNLSDGVASAIRIVQSSGLGAADRAAVKAVQSAAFPPPPPGLQGKDGNYQIWVACL